MQRLLPKSIKAHVLFQNESSRKQSRLAASTLCIQRVSTNISLIEDFNGAKITPTITTNSKFEAYSLIPSPACKLPCIETKIGCKLSGI